MRHGVPSANEYIDPRATRSFSPTVPARLLPFPVARTTSRERFRSRPKRMPFPPCIFPPPLLSSPVAAAKCELMNTVLLARSRSRGSFRAFAAGGHVELRTSRVAPQRRTGIARYSRRRRRKPLFARRLQLPHGAQRCARLRRSRAGKARKPAS